MILFHPHCITRNHTFVMLFFKIKKNKTREVWFCWILSWKSQQNRTSIAVFSKTKQKLQRKCNSVVILNPEHNKIIFSLYIKKQKQNARRSGNSGEKNGGRRKGKEWEKYADKHFCLFLLFFQKVTVEISTPKCDGGKIYVG